MTGNTSTENQNDTENKDESQENGFNVPTMTDSHNNGAPIEKPSLTTLKFITNTATTSFTFKSCKYTSKTLFNK